MNKVFACRNAYSIQPDKKHEYFSLHVEDPIKNNSRTLREGGGVFKDLKGGGGGGQPQYDQPKDTGTRFTIEHQKEKLVQLDELIQSINESVY